MASHAERFVTSNQKSPQATPQGRRLLWRRASMSIVGIRIVSASFFNFDPRDDGSENQRTCASNKRRPLIAITAADAFCSRIEQSRQPK